MILALRTGKEPMRAHIQVRVALEYFDRRLLIRIEHVPVEHGRIGDEAQRVNADPLPEQHVFAHGVRLDLGLGAQVEDLQRPLRRLERDNLPVPVHDGAVGLDGPAHDVAMVFEVDDDDFGLGFFAGFLTDANEIVGFECLSRISFDQGVASRRDAYAGVEANRSLLVAMLVGDPGKGAAVNILESQRLLATREVVSSGRSKQEKRMMATCKLSVKRMGRALLAMMTTGLRAFAGGLD